MLHAPPNPSPRPPGLWGRITRVFESLAAVSPAPIAPSPAAEKSQRRFSEGVALLSDLPIFLAEERAKDKTRRETLQRLGVDPKVIDEVIQLYRLRKAASFLGGDTHVGACTTETALAFADFIAGELPRLRADCSLTDAASYNDPAHIVDDIRSRCAAQPIVHDERFAAKGQSFVSALEYAVHKAHVAFHHSLISAEQQAVIISVPPRFIDLVFRITAQRIRLLLSPDVYDELSRAVRKIS